MANKISDAFKTAGKYALTAHARDRIRQRIGIESEEAATAWVAEAIKKAKHTRRDGNKTCYVSDMFEIVCDRVKVVTVKPTEPNNGYLTKFNDLLAKETRKLLSVYKRELRKAEIALVETQLNYLKARNPRTKEAIMSKLTEAADLKALYEDEIKDIEKAAERYGVEV